LSVIQIKSPRDIELMRRAGKLTAAARSLASGLVTPGVTTRQIEKEVHNFLSQNGAKPSFLNYNGFPGAICISVNDEIIHGIPGKRVINNGDIVSLDIGAFLGGFHGDCACTIPCGDVSDDALRLIEVTRQCFFEGLKYARQGNRVCDIGGAIEKYAESYGYGVVKEYVGHGIGRNLHEDPEVPNYGAKKRGARLVKGMTIAIEPMINLGTADIKTLSDKWTVVTADGKYSAHYENTVLITDGEPEILTSGGEGRYV